MAQTVKDDEDLKLKLKEAGDKLVVLDFFATWCKICKTVDSEVEDMTKTKEMKDVMFFKVDVQECESIATEYAVSVLPTIVFVKKGEKLESLEGSKNVSKLKEYIDKLKK